MVRSGFRRKCYSKKIFGPSKAFSLTNHYPVDFQSGSEEGNAPVLRINVTHSGTTGQGLDKGKFRYVLTQRVAYRLKTGRRKKGQICHDRSFLLNLNLQLIGDEGNEENILNNPPDLFHAWRSHYQYFKWKITTMLANEYYRRDQPNKIDWRLGSISPLDKKQRPPAITHQTMKHLSHYALKHLHVHTCIPG